MLVWKHKEWQTFGGTWMIVSHTMTDQQIIDAIKANPKKYGDFADWSKK